MAIRTFIRHAWLRVLSGLATCQAQPSSVSFQCYITDIQFGSYSRIASGILFDLTDSTIILAPLDGLKSKMVAILIQHHGTLPPTDSLRQPLSSRVYRYSQASQIVIQGRGNEGKGAAIGVILGLVTGFALGGGKPGFSRIKAYEKAIAGDIVFSLAGLGIGAATTRRIKSAKRSMTVDTSFWFLRFYVVEQIKQTIIYTP